MDETPEELARLQERFRPLGDRLEEALTVGVDDLELGTDMANAVLDNDDDALFACGLFAGTVHQYGLDLFSPNVVLRFEPLRDGLDRMAMSIGIVLARKMLTEHDARATGLLWAYTPPEVHSVTLGILFAGACEAVRHYREVKEPAQWN